MTAAPGQPPPGVPGGGEWASRRPASGMVNGIIPGLAGGGWSGRTGNYLLVGMLPGNPGLSGE